MANIKSFPNNQDEYIGAEYVMRWLHGRTSGVFGADGNAAVSPVLDTMAVYVSDGNGWLSNDNADGIVWWFDNEKTGGAKLQLPVDMADAVLPRIDRVIVSWQTTNYVALPEVKILNGTAASSPTAPALTNNNLVRQISLARIEIPAGVSAITAAMITDERLDPSVCGLVTESVQVDTSMMQAQLDAVLDETKDKADAVLDGITRELAELEAGTDVELKKLLFSNTVVPVSAFAEDTTYEDFPYRASVALSGVLSTMIPDVILSITDATSGGFAPVAECYNGGVYLYAESVPAEAITIPTIICWRGNAE